MIRGGAIGDFILTLPVLAALRRQFPRAHLEVLGYPHIAQLALAGGLVERVRSIEARPLAGFFARNGELAEELADYFSEFDLIISYLYDPDQIFRLNVGRCTRAQFIPGPHRPEESLNLHATEVLLKPLETLAIFDADRSSRLEIRQSIRYRRLARAAGWMSIPATAARARTGRRQDRWNCCGALMESTTLHVLLAGGEAERGRLERLAAALPATRIKIMQNAALPELAQWLASCLAFIGHDSGISHLAAAVGLRSLILWGNTAEVVWRPRGRELTILRGANGLEGLSVPVVVNQLEKLLQCQ